VLENKRVSRLKGELEEFKHQSHQKRKKKKKECITKGSWRSGCWHWDRQPESRGAGEE
jgi:hypothetical protein